MADIFKLVGSIFVDTDQANDSLSKVDKKAESVGSTLLSGAKKAGKFAVGLGGAALGVASTFTKLASDSAETADEIDKASQRMKIGAESYQELAHAASLSGVEMSTLEKAAKKLEGTDLNFDDAMEQIYALGTAEERSAKAAELFGESVAYQMTPMLNASAEDMAAMKQEAHDLGLVLSEDTVKSGAELNDAISKVKDSIGGVVTQLGASLMPIILDVCNEIIAFMPTIMEIVNEIMPILSDLMASLLPILMDLAEQLLPPILKLIEALLPLFQLLCELILPPLITLLTTIATVIADKVLPIVIKVVEKVKDVIEKAPAKFKAFKETIVNTFEAIKDGLKKPINAVIGMINKLIDGLNSMQINVPSWVTDLTGISSFGFNLKRIPELANGGQIVGEGSAIVGEAGAELINMPKGATVTPLQRGETALNADKILETLQSMREENLAFMMSFEESVASALNNVGIKWDDRELGRMVKRYA